MKQHILFSILSLSILLFSCDDDNGPSISPEQRQLIMGDTGTGIFALGLASPIVLERDNVHSNVRELDMDQNGDLDVIIRAYEDFFGNKGLVISTVNEGTDAAVMTNDDGFVMPLNGGDIVKFEEGIWTSVEEAPLAVFDTSDQSTQGIWNGLANKFVAFRSLLEKV
mgnify:CR=1 FL=1